MKRIELIGPSGVGKTTLYKQITRTPLNSRPYLTLKDAYKLAAINESIPISNFKLWLFQQLLKLELFESKTRGLGKHILYSLNRKSEYAVLDDSNAIMVSYNILLEHLKYKPNPFIIFKRLKQYTEKVEEFIILNHSLRDNNYILFDEGMVHYHSGITEYGELNFSYDQIKGDSVLSPSCIVYCEQTADTIFEQAIQRKNSGIRTFTHGRMSDSELRDYIEKDVQEHQTKISLFKKYNIPVLHIDTQQRVDSIIKKINDFVRRHKK